MSSVLERSLAIIELLTTAPAGLQVSDIAKRLEQSPSGTHRILAELAKLGYVAQNRTHGEYVLTIKMSALGLTFLGQSGITDVAQPILEKLAQQTKELVRLSVIDASDLVWVAVAQGATSGLRYDPGREQGVTVTLDRTAGGLAWLATMSDEDALLKLAEQRTRHHAFDITASAPLSVQDTLDALRHTRNQGFAQATNTYIDGMAAIAVPVRNPRNNQVLGALSIGGPEVRMTQERITEFVPLLKVAANDLGSACEGSKYFKTLD